MICVLTLLQELDDRAEKLTILANTAHSPPQEVQSPAETGDGSEADAPLDAAGTRAPSIPQEPQEQQV